MNRKVYHTSLIIYIFCFTYQQKLHQKKCRKQIPKNWQDNDARIMFVQEVVHLAVWHGNLNRVFFRFQVVWVELGSSQSVGKSERTFASWWLNQPFERYARQIGSFPQGSGWKEKHLKPPPSFSSFCPAKDTWKTVGNSQTIHGEPTQKKPPAQALILSSSIHKKNDHPQ